MRLRKYYEKETGDVREECLLSRSEQETEYERCLNEILKNTREVLDSLEYQEEFKVNWKNYREHKNGRHSG